MAHGKQAKILSKGQVDADLGYVAWIHRPVTNGVIYHLSRGAERRAEEIAQLKQLGG